MEKMLPPPPRAVSSEKQPNGKEAFSVENKASKEVCKEDLGTMAWDYDDQLPEGWRRVPSSSRPGQFSYSHTSGLKQSKRPSRPPSEAEIAAFKKLVAKKRKRVDSSKKGKGRSVNKLESVATTATWQSYMKTGRNKSAKLRSNPMEQVE